jgi:hypothetical protein
LQEPGGKLGVGGRYARHELEHGKRGIEGAALAGARVALPRALDLRTLAVPASKGALALFFFGKGLALDFFLVAMWFSDT